MPLVDAAGVVVLFLSYKGFITAINGPAFGLTSTDIGVAEAGAEAASLSLQLTGAGSQAADFSWTAPTAGSLGAVNAGQAFVAPAANGTLPIGDVSVVDGNDGATDLVFTVTRAGGSDGAVSASYSGAFGTGAGQAFAADFAPDFVGNGVVSFAAGQTSAAIRLPVVGDSAIEVDETFTVELSAPQGRATLGDAVATGPIANNDAAPPAGPAKVFIYEIHTTTLAATSARRSRSPGRRAST